MACSPSQYSLRIEFGFIYLQNGIQALLRVVFTDPDPKIWDDVQMETGSSEFNILSQICRPEAVLDPRVLIGPGDDLAMVRVLPPGEDGVGETPTVLLAGVDQLIDGLHVSIEDAGLKAAGHKAIARSLSDIAAMCGRPVATLVSAVLPLKMTESDSMILFDAMKATADRHHAPLVGGDLAYHQTEEGPLTCSVTVLAVPPPQGSIERFGAEAGDGIYVTGELGNGWRSDHHLTFEPRLSEASMLRAILGDRLHAMIDISDGLGRDAAHLVERSSLQIVLESTELPLRSNADIEAAIVDGEDYELLFAACGEVPEGLGACPVTRIGTVRESTSEAGGSVLLSIDGRQVDVSRKGWEHAGHG